MVPHSGSGGLPRFLLRKAFAAQLLMEVLSATSPAAAETDCDVPQSLIQTTHPLTRTAEALRDKRPLRVVAIGSSSTQGAGATSAAASYPSQLELFLQKSFSGSLISVLNLGVGGQEIKDMLQRFDVDVAQKNPDLIILQVGTNAVMRNESLEDFAVSLRQTLDLALQAGADVMIMDTQSTPAYNAKPHALTMVELIAKIAEEKGVNVIRRFEIMEHWQKVAGIAAPVFSASDNFHMNDWGYACLAVNAGEAIRGGVGQAMPEPRGLPVDNSIRVVCYFGQGC